MRTKNKTADCQIQDPTGRLLTTIQDKLQRWREFFHELLYTADPDADCKADSSDPPPGREIHDVPPDEPPPTLSKVRAALNRLKSRKAAGPDGITSELLKYAGPTLVRKFHELVKQVWETERAPQDWKDALIVTLYKKKDPTLCDNYRGLSLLSVPGKLYSLLLLDPLQERLEKTVMDSQSGFRKGRGTTDHLFTLQQILHESWEFDKPTHTCFIDLRKAYDTVNRPALWGILKHIGLSAKIQRLIRDLHTGTRSSVRAYGRKSKPLMSTAAFVKDASLPPLFSTSFSTMCFESLYMNATRV